MEMPSCYALRGPGCRGLRDTVGFAQPLCPVPLLLRGDFVCGLGGAMCSEAPEAIFCQTVSLRVRNLRDPTDFRGVRRCRHAAPHQGALPVLTDRSLEQAMKLGIYYVLLMPSTVNATSSAPNTCAMRTHVLGQASSLASNPPLFFNASRIRECGRANRNRGRQPAPVPAGARRPAFYVPRHGQTSG